MIKLKEPLTVRDRWNFKVTYLEEHEYQTFTPEGMAYIMLNKSMYFNDDGYMAHKTGCVQTSSRFGITTDEGTAVVIEYPGLHLLEDRIYIQNELDMGNLAYMDGGTNTTALNPGRLGDPVVNYVHFPAGMHQTLHTHPSHRIGLCVSGNGRVQLEGHEYFDVKNGEAFFMRRNELHNFMCQDEDVVLFVWAPDSGTGPTDEVNPLKVRTYVGQQFTK